MSAYNIAVCDIGFSHITSLSQYIRFVGGQVFLNIFLQLISDSDRINVEKLDNFTKVLLNFIGKTVF